MLYVGTYPQIYPPTILRLGIVSRDGLPRGTLPSGILKLEKYCPGLKVLHSTYQSQNFSILEPRPRNREPNFKAWTFFLIFKMPDGRTPRGSPSRETIP